MAKQQKPRAESLHVNGRTIRVSPTSDLDASVIKLMAAHQEALTERCGDSGPASVPQNPALAAVFKAKGLIH